jgi:hypothetical protein
MTVLFGFLFLLSVFGLVIGLAKPSLVIKWGGKRTRGRVFLVYGGAAFVLLILLGIIASTEKEEKTFSKLNILSVTYESGKVIVSGETDLPDGSGLTIFFNVKGRKRGGRTRVETKVKEGKFETSFSPPKHPDFAQGHYSVEVLFTPRGQSKEVLKLVGENGERLTGDKVGEAIGFRVMETSKEIKLKLAIPSYPMVGPEDYPLNSPERAFAEFLASWKMKDWDRMVKFTQKTWRSGKDKAVEELQYKFEFQELLGAEIIGKESKIFEYPKLVEGRLEVRKAKDALTVVRAKIFWSIDGLSVKEGIIRANVIRETAPYEPSVKGEWGVNPDSIRKVAVAPPTEKE